MNQTTTDYVSQGVKTSRHLLNGFKITYFHYFIFTLSSLIGKLFFLSYPLFAMADYQLAHQIVKDKKVVFANVYEDSESSKKYQRALQWALINQAVLLVGIVLIGLLTYGLHNVGVLIDDLYGFNHAYTQFIFNGISGILFLLFILQRSLQFSPVIYLIQSSDISLADALHQSKRMMDASGKSKLLQIHVHCFMKLLIYGLLAGIVVFVLTFIFEPVAVVLFAIMLGILGGYLYPKVSIPHRLSVVKLFHDLNHRSSLEVLEEEKDSGVSEVFKNTLTKEALLEVLFDSKIKTEKEL